MGRPPKQWTNKEIKYITKFYGKTSAKKIAENLNLKTQQIIQKARNLGLKSNLNLFKLRNKKEQNILKINAKGFTLIGEYITLRKRTQFLCRCGIIFECPPYSLISGEKTSCGCNKGWALRRGTDVISLTYFNNLKNKAKERKLSFEITIEYLSELLKKQDFKCKLSGIQIDSGYKATTSASVDRIDSSKGYIEGNVQWIHKDLQNMKWNKSQNDFVLWCHKISDFQRGKA